MDTFTINIPTTITQRVIDALCLQFQYQATVQDPKNPSGPQIPNPIPKREFARQQIAAMVANVVMNNETNQALRTAQTTAQNKALDILIS